MSETKAKYHQVERRTNRGTGVATEVERVVEVPDGYYPEIWKVDDSVATFDWRPTGGTPSVFPKPGAVKVVPTTPAPTVPSVPEGEK